MKRALAAMAALGLAGCVTVPAPPPSSSLEQGMLIARVETHGALFHKSTRRADAASLIAIDEKGSPVPGQAARSGFASGGYVVFFDLPAGRYVLKSALFPARGVHYRVDAPEEGEFKRSVVLRPGSAAYLGDLGFDSTWPEFGTAMLRAGIIVGHWFTFFLKRPVIQRDAAMHYFEAGPAAESRALLAVRDSLTGTPWRRMADARLRELSAPEPVKTDGGLRPKELPLHEEPLLSWRDTLKWGEPRRAPQGLAWRKPGTDTQVALFFTTASAAGFAGWEAAVSELRATAAASVEDQGGVYEVRVATRVGMAAKATKYVYPEGTLVGSQTTVVVTETTLIPDGYGIYTARLRAPRAEFDAAVPAYREFLLQVVLGPPKPKPPPKQEAVMPYMGVP